MNYFVIKHIHMTAAGLSILLFILRAFWSVTESPLLQKKLVKIVPHVIDTILLVAAVALAMMIGPYQPWILTKVVLLVVYIGLGTVAIKRGKTPRQRLMAAVLAVLVYMYILSVALAHDPLGWFAG
ncbi:MAG: SirB2 family protein [Alcaligenaceae bacterium]|nr:SirB2 family protein [Alcaligenaceae bacterium]